MSANEAKGLAQIEKPYRSTTSSTFVSSARLKRNTSPTNFL